MIQTNYVTKCSIIVLCVIQNSMAKVYIFKAILCHRPTHIHRVRIISVHKLTLCVQLKIMHPPNDTRVHLRTAEEVHYRRIMHTNTLGNASLQG